jgi:hypothetical protein
MAAKRKSKAKKSKPRTRTSDPAQSARFLETAKKLEADESGGAFDLAINAVTQPRKKPPK